MEISTPAHVSILTSMLLNLNLCPILIVAAMWPFSPLPYLLPEQLNSLAL